MKPVANLNRPGRRFARGPGVKEPRCVNSPAFLADRQHVLRGLLPR